MSRGPLPGRAAVTGILLAGALGAQATRPSTNPWFAGWLAETLDRDFVTARELYAKASTDENLVLEHRLLAIVRLAEFQLANGQLQALRNSGQLFRQLRARTQAPPFGNEVDPAWEALQALGGEFRETLALADGTERAQRLPALRQRVRAFVTARREPPEPRPWLQNVIRGLLQLPAVNDVRTEGARQPRTLAEFRKGSRMRAAEIARLRLDGHVEQAERLQTLSIRQPPGIRPRKLGAGNPQEVLARAIRRLNDALQRERRTDLYAVERVTLERLRERLLDCQERGRHAEGVDLVKALPIYDFCFLADLR
jgi:hypothetical protein